MSCVLEYNLDQVLPFVQRFVHGLPRADGMKAIGLRRYGRLVAGVIYEGFNGHNVWMHVGAEPGGRWLTRTYLKACFVYPFMVGGVERVSGYVNASNEKSVRFLEHLGFEREATLAGAAPDGRDVFIYVMWRADWSRALEGRAKGVKHADSE